MPHRCKHSFPCARAGPVTRSATSGVWWARETHQSTAKGAMALCRRPAIAAKGHLSADLLKRTKNDRCKGPLATTDGPHIPLQKCKLKYKRLASCKTLAS